MKNRCTLSLTHLKPRWPAAKLPTSRRCSGRCRELPDPGTLPPEGPQSPASCLWPPFPDQSSPLTYSLLKMFKHNVSKRPFSFFFFCVFVRPLCSEFFSCSGLCPISQSLSFLKFIFLNPVDKLHISANNILPASRSNITVNKG